MKNNTLPPTSYPSADDETAFPVTPPQIEGYKILGELGKAGQGCVWRALQLSTRREVALKVPRTGVLSSKKGLARFEREVELAARLKHPNIARIHDSGVHQGLYYYTMDLIEGTAFDQYVKQHNLTQRQILELMQTICQAVQHAHQLGVIHRDLKPSNILVTEDGQPHIVDFGLAKNILEEDLLQTVSITGEAVGTPAYMSPEQASGNMDEVDTRTDVYSLGVILFSLLAGENPHDLSGSRDEILHRVAKEEVRRPRKINPQIDKELEALLLKSLDNDPDKRYTSAGELAKDIDNYLKHEPLSAKGPTTIYFLRKRIRKYRRPISIACLMATALIVVGWFVSYAAKRQQALETHLKEIERLERFAGKPILYLDFGVYVSDEPAEMYEKFQPVISRIQKHTEQQLEQKVDIRLKIFHNYSDAINALVEGKVDFVRFGPVSYIIAKNRNPNIQLLVMELREGKELFKGMIVVRKDSNIKELSDLKGRSFAFGDRNSTIGRHFIQAEMVDVGIYEDDLAGYDYHRSHTEVAEAVRDGKFDAGAVKDTTFWEYENDLRVIKDFNNVTKPWIAKEDLDPNVFSALQSILIALKDQEVLGKLKVSGFRETSDSEYDFVRRHMKEAERFSSRKEEQ